MRAAVPLALLLLSPLPPSGQGEADEVDSRDFLAWARESAVELDSLEWSETDPKAFAFLDEALKGKRIVYLGETDHGVAERMEFRLLLIRELARRGFRRIGMEMGLSDAKRMDRYLETGDETCLERVALYGYRGDLRENRKDEIAGWTDDSNPELIQAAQAEARWFLRELRRIGEELPEGEPRLSWFGYDLSIRPGGGYADAAELLAPHQGQALFDAVMERMARVPGESRIEEAERIEALVVLLDERRDELVHLLGDAGALELRRALQRMADAFRFIEGLQGQEEYDPEAVAEALERRERRMDHNMDEHLAEWPPDEKIILLGHALHLSQDSTAIHTQGFGDMWESIGTHVEREHPGEVYGIWLLHHRGRHGVPRAQPPILPFLSPRGSVERILRRVHPILILPLGSGDPREAWLDEERVFCHSGAPARAVLPRQVDCLFFVEVAGEPGKRPGERGQEPR